MNDGKREVKAACRLSINEACDKATLELEFTEPVDPMEIVGFLQDYVDSFKESLERFEMLPKKDGAKH